MNLSARSISSTETSPYTSPLQSPFQSRGESPTESPNGSPANSPMILRRANSYKHKLKKHVNTHRSTLDELIRKKREIRRLRSKSTPEIPHNFDLNKKGNVSARSSISEGSMSDDKEIESSRENLSKLHLEQPEQKPKKSPSQSRRKSLQAFIGAKLNQLREDHSIKLGRSNSYRVTTKPKENVTENKLYYSEDDENYNGPLFLATTIFVPGYDFKTKQATPTPERKQSTPVFGRRGSKDRLTLPLGFNRNTKERKSTGSTPNLFRRGSKEKIKTKDVVHVEKRFQRSDSSPVDSKLAVHSITDNDLDYSTVLERQAMLKAKYKRFEDFGKHKDITIKVPQTNDQGKVKRISGRFENGSVFLKKTGEIHIDTEKKKIAVLDTDTFRQRANTFETGSAYKQHSYAESDTSNNTHSNNNSKRQSFVDTEKSKKPSNLDSLNSASVGGESGYASPTEISDNANDNDHLLTPNKIFRNFYLDKIRSETVNSSYTITDPLSIDNCSNSWRSGKKKYQIIKRPDIPRVISTDLCITEL